MYFWTLMLHSWLRWFVIIAGVVVVARALVGWSGHRPWTGADDAAGRWFVVSLDVQLVIGLVLYAVLSPITRAAFADMGAAMANTTWRFWAVEHLFLAVVAIVLAHIGRVRSRKAATPVGRHRAALIFYGVALVAVIASIPWPFLAYGRPLLRM
jgi:hypothetical protein